MILVLFVAAVRIEHDNLLFSGIDVGNFLLSICLL